MAARRRVIGLAIEEEDLTGLMSIARSRTEPASRVERARILLAYRETPSCYAVGRVIGVTHQTVERCLRRALRLGIMGALDDSPRPGREPVITDEARSFIVDLACRKAKELGYPHELWTTRLSGATRPRTWSSGRSYVPCQPGPGHFVQDPRSAGSQAAQGALLPGTPRPRVRSEDGGGSVRLPRGRASSSRSSRRTGSAKPGGGDRLLR